MTFIKGTDTTLNHRRAWLVDDNSLDEHMVAFSLKKIDLQSLFLWPHSVKRFLDASKPRHVDTTVNGSFKCHLW